MEQTINQDRQIRLWGKPGQKLIEDSNLAIIGSDNLGLECVKSASILGVNNIYFIDNKRSSGKFLDLSLKKQNKVEEISDIVKKYLNSESNIEGIFSTNSITLLKRLGNLSAIIDTTNNPTSKYFCKLFSEFNNTPFFSASCSNRKGKFSYFSPLEGYEKDKHDLIIRGFEEDPQGTIISNIFSGIIIEEFRKNLFLSNKDLFKNVRIALRNGEIKDNKGNYLNYLDQHLQYEYLFRNDLFFDIFDNKKIDFVNEKRLLKKKKALVLGAGSIGNYVSDILARLSLEKICVVDFDKFDDTNLNRQPLAYNSIGQYKAKVLANRINSISNKNNADYVLGFIGEELDKGLLKKSGCNLSEIELLNYDWFEKNKNDFDIVFGCFDNFDVRLMTTEYTTKLKIKYIDGGSGGSKANQSRVVNYIPGVTNCYKCLDQMGIFSKENLKKSKEQRKRDALIFQKRYEENRNAYEGVASIGNASCRAEWVPGSINMSNQVCAGLMVSEAVKSVSGIGNIYNQIKYEASSRRPILKLNSKFKCKCGD